MLMLPRVNLMVKLVFRDDVEPAPAKISRKSGSLVQDEGRGEQAFRFVVFFANVYGGTRGRRAGKARWNFDQVIEEELVGFQRE